MDFDLYSSFFSLKYVLSYGGGAIEELFEAGAFLKAHKLIKAAFPDAQIDYRSFPIEPAFGDTSAAKTSTFLPR